MKSEVESRPVFRRILYSQAWEDPRSDIDGWQLDDQDDVLAVGASGDNPLAYLAAGARSVTAIDFNPTQNHLLELKLSAIETLDPEDVQAFLGARTATPSARDAFYRHVAPSLSDDARAFWDSAPELLAEGVIHVGRFERYLSYFRNYLFPLIHRRRVGERLFQLDDLAAQADYYHRVWDNRRWRFLFRIFFGRRVMGRLGRDPAFFKYVEVDQVGDAFRGRFEHALTQIPVADNWFLEYMVLGRYTDPAQRLPPYLRPDQQAILRESGRQRLTLEVGSFEQYLPTQPADRFSCFYLSDIFEWMSEDAFSALLDEFWRVGRHDGRLTFRNLLVPREHPPSAEGKFVHERERSREIHHNDRSFVYGNFVIERIVKDAS